MLQTTHKNIAIISTPFVGHYQALITLAKQLVKSNQNLAITFIITGWENVVLNNMDRDKIKSHGINLIEIYDEPIKIPAPFYFTFPRVVNLTDQAINACKQQDLLIYDYFSIEAYIAGKQLNIPAICSTSSIMGPLDKNHPVFLQALAANANDIKQLEDKYKIDLMQRIEMLGDSFFIPSDYQTIQWSWPSLVQADDYMQNRQLMNNTFMRPAWELIKPKQKTSDKKIIYVSFGTVVTRHLWEPLPPVRDFIKNIFNTLARDFGDHDQYEVIISTGRAVSDIFEKLPSNFHTYETVAQTEVLQYADVFITHGGGNSVNEAIDNNVPMIVIPFFGDQHQSAMNIHKLKIGKAFLHEEQDQAKVLDAASGLYARKSLAESGVLTKAIIEVLNNTSFKEAIQKMKVADEKKSPPTEGTFSMFFWS